MTPLMKYSDEERAWLKAHSQDTQVTAWRPPARTELSAGAVNGMTAAAQWGYKADTPTPKVKVKGLANFPCDANELAAFHGKRKPEVKPRRQSDAARKAAAQRLVIDGLRDELVAANERIADLEGILKAVRMEVAA